MRPLFDAHLDLAWNALSFDRDQLAGIEQLRADEAGMTGKGRGRCTVTLPELRRAGVGVCLATVLSRARPTRTAAAAAAPRSAGDRQRGPTIQREDLDHANQTIASAVAQGQLAYYRLLEERGHLRVIRDAATLDAAWARWCSDDRTAPIGCILSMEGADPIIEPEHAQWWWDQGLRTACLAHYGPSAYAMGTGGDGPLTTAGRQLLRQFQRLGLILDLVHTADSALDEALDQYAGPVFVSHGNCRALVPHDRQMSDDQIRRIAQRGGVLGVVLDAWMLRPNWRKDGTDRQRVELATVADHVDHICQVAGDCGHVGIGSDLDGGFGTEQCPRDLDTIADLQKLDPILSRRGYSGAQIDAIFHGNWLSFFRKALPRG